MSTAATLTILTSKIAKYLQQAHTWQHSSLSTQHKHALPIGPCGIERARGKLRNMSGNKHGLGPGPFIAHAARKEVRRAPEPRLDSPILADVLPSSNRCNGLQTLSCQTPASQSNSAQAMAFFCWKHHFADRISSKPSAMALSDRQVQFGLSHLSLLGRDSGRAILLWLRKIGYSFVLRIFFWLFGRSLVCRYHSSSSSESNQLQQYLFGFLASGAHFWLRFALLLWNFLLLRFSSLSDLVKKWSSTACGNTTTVLNLCATSRFLGTWSFLLPLGKVTEVNLLKQSTPVSTRKDPDLQSKPAFFPKSGKLIKLMMIFPWHPWQGPGISHGFPISICDPKSSPHPAPKMTLGIQPEHWNIYRGQGCLATLPEMWVTIDKLVSSPKYRCFIQFVLGHLKMGYT